MDEVEYWYVLPLVSVLARHYTAKLLEQKNAVVDC